MNTEQLTKAYEQMLLIRKAEDCIAADFRNRKIFSFLHLTTGQEAIAVGVASALKPHDRMWGNHRSHGHYLAKGGDLYRMFCEIYGKADGCCRGYGGSMHMLDRSVGFMGSTPILGSIVSIAAGSAFEQKQRTRDEISVVFCGDGASEEGVVYETINTAAVMELPLILVIENNLFSVNTPANVRRHRGFSRRSVVEGLGAGYWGVVDGNDVEDVNLAITSARVYATTSGPAVVEVMAFRAMAHSGPIMDESCRLLDTARVRADADPMVKLRNTLLAHGVDANVLALMEQKIAADVDLAHASALRANDPNPDGMSKGVYAGV